MGCFGKTFGMKAGTEEVGIGVQHGTCLILSTKLIGKDGGYCAYGVSESLNRGVLMGSSFIIVDLVKEA